MRDAHRVILIEDSPQDAAFARRAIADLDVEVELVVWDRPAEIGERLGRLLAGGWLPDLILLDLKMPAMDGHEVLAEIRARKTHGEVPVVVFSSSQEPSELVRAYTCGANSYIAKPVVFEEFREAVKDTVRYWTTLNRRAPQGAT